MGYGLAMATSVFTLDPDDALDVERTPVSPLVFASPHSGDVYPDDLGGREDLPELSLRSAEDALVNRLVAPQSDLGVPLIAARLGRAYVDLNRDPDELDPQVVEGAEASSPRVTAGFGVIPRLTGDGRTIRDHALAHEDALARLAAAHRPYHEALERLMHRTRDRFGYAVLVDWHSMPSRAVLQRVHGVVAVLARRDLVTSPLEGAGQESAQGSIVFRQKNSRHRALLAAPFLWPSP